MGFNTLNFITIFISLNIIPFQCAENISIVSNSTGHIVQQYNSYDPHAYRPFKRSTHLSPKHNDRLVIFKVFTSILILIAISMLIARCLRYLKNQNKQFPGWLSRRLGDRGADNCQESEDGVDNGDIAQHGAAGHVNNDNLAQDEAAGPANNGDIAQDEAAGPANDGDVAQGAVAGTGGGSPVDHFQVVKSHTMDLNSYPLDSQFSHDTFQNIIDLNHKIWASNLAREVDMVIEKQEYDPNLPPGAETKLKSERGKIWRNEILPNLAPGDLSLVRMAVDNLRYSANNVQVYYRNVDMNEFISLLNTMNGSAEVGKEDIDYLKDCRGNPQFYPRHTKFAGNADAMLKSLIALHNMAVPHRKIIKAALEKIKLSDTRLLAIIQAESS